MGGSNCAVVGCPTEKTRWPYLTFHRLPKKGTGNDQWRAALVHALRRADDVNYDNVFICSRHFTDDCFIQGEKRRRLKPGSLPTEFMPPVVGKAVQPVTRKAPHPRPPPEVPVVVAHYDLKDVEAAAQKLEGWTCHLKEDVLHVSKGDIVMKVSSNLLVRAVFQGMPAPDRWSLESMKLRVLAKQLEEMTVCQGSKKPEIQELAPYPHLASGKSYQRIYCSKFVDEELQVSSTVRSKSCQVIGQSDICSACQQVEETLTAKSTLTAKDIKPNRPLSTVPTATLKELVKLQRQEKKKLQATNQQMAEKISEDIENEAVPVSDELNSSFSSLIEAAQRNDFLTVFWDQQKKALAQDPRGMRWHPMMIRFAIYLHSQSAAAYQSLREINILKLPGETTLRNYTNVFPGTEGLQTHLLLEMKKRAEQLPEKDCYVALLHDEMSIRSDLVYDQRSGEIVGFVNPDSWNFEKDYTDNIATHMLTFMVVSMAGNGFKDAVASFSTRGATCAELYSMMWEVIHVLENTVGLKVIISTSDKAGPNQRLYRMLGDGYKVTNLTAMPHRYLYFISDPPHLIKTVRNCLYHSRAGGTRYMWNQGKHLLWQHIFDVYSTDLRNELYMTKLRDDHVRLNPRSMMNVQLAAQVLSNSVATILREYCGSEVEETAKLVDYMNKFFDITNVRFLTEAEQRRNPMLAAFTTPEDERFKFLKGFLKYLDDWEASVKNRPGPFTAGDRAKMMLSRQTLDGLKMTAKSLLEVIPFLLENGITFVLTSKFNQDPLEEYFGRHRMFGRRSENPNVREFRHQSNKLHMQRELAHQMKPHGNTRGRSREEREPAVSDSPLKKRRR